MGGEAFSPPGLKQATVHGVAKSRSRLSMHTHTRKKRDGTLNIECKCKYILDLALCLWMPCRESLANSSALGNSAKHAMQ